MMSGEAKRPMPRWCTRLGILSFLSLFLLATAGSAALAQEHTFELYQYNKDGQVEEVPGLDLSNERKEAVADIYGTKETPLDDTLIQNQMKWATDTLEGKSPKAVIEGMFAALKKAMSDKVGDKGISERYDNMIENFSALDKDDFGKHFDKDGKEISNQKGMDQLFEAMKQSGLKDSLLKLLKSKSSSSAWVKRIFSDARLRDLFHYLTEKPKEKKKVKDPEPKEPPKKNAQVKDPEDGKKGKGDNKNDQGMPPGNNKVGEQPAPVPPAVSQPCPVGQPGPNPWDQLMNYLSSLANRNRRNNDNGLGDQLAQLGRQLQNQLDKNPNNEGVRPPQTGQQAQLPPNQPQQDDKRPQGQAPDRQDAGPGSVTMQPTDFGQPEKAQQVQTNELSVPRRAEQAGNQAKRMVSDATSSIDTGKRAIEKLNSSISTYCGNPNPAFYSLCKSAVGKASRWASQMGTWVSNLKSVASRTEQVAAQERRKLEQMEKDIENQPGMSDAVARLQRLKEAETRVQQAQQAAEGAPQQLPDGRTVDKQTAVASAKQALVAAKAESTKQEQYNAKGKKSLISQLRDQMDAADESENTAAEAKQKAQEAESLASEAEDLKETATASVGQAAAMARGAGGTDARDRMIANGTKGGARGLGAAAGAGVVKAPSAGGSGPGDRRPKLGLESL